jgi:hypothetical protein
VATGLVVAVLLAVGSCVVAWAFDHERTTWDPAKPEYRREGRRAALAEVIKTVAFFGGIYAVAQFCSTRRSSFDRDEGGTQTPWGVDKE